MTLRSQVLSSGVEVWVCQTDGCGFETTGEREALDHSTGCGVNHDKRLSVPGLESMLEDYRERVEAELAARIKRVLLAVAHSNRGEPRYHDAYRDAANIAETVARGHWIGPGSEEPG